MVLFRNVFKGDLVIILMKRGLAKHRKPNKEFYLEWGISGLKISLLILILVLIALLYLLFLETKSLYEIGNILFSFPNFSGFLFVYAGIILFIIAPFYAGILIGRRIEKK